METETEYKPGQIYALLPKVAADVGAIGKSRRNEHQKFNFRGIDDVMNYVHPALTKHGVVAMPMVTDVRREALESGNGKKLLYTILTVRYRFTAPDGSFSDAVVVGEGMDSGDKSANKAMSAAFKYALGQVLSIPFDVVDSEDDDPQPVHAQQRPAAPNGNGNGHAAPWKGEPAARKVPHEQISRIDQLMVDVAGGGGPENDAKWAKWLASKGVPDVGLMTMEKAAEIEEALKEKLNARRIGR